jgi:hypothetical protein
VIVLKALRPGRTGRVDGTGRTPLGVGPAYGAQELCRCNSNLSDRIRPRYGDVRQRVSIKELNRRVGANSPPI